jgi:hypothetical protein
VVEQSRSASKLGWPIPSNGAAVTAWCGSSSAALRLGCPWRRGSPPARECMCVYVHGHTAANRCTRCRATTKRWRLSAAGAPSCERRSTVGNGLSSGGLVGSRVCMPKGNPRRRAPGGTEKVTTRPCVLSTEDSMVKGGALVGFLGAARTTVKHQSGGAAFSLPACSHRRISAPGCARVRLRTPEGDALPPSVCACASQRLDLGGELGDSVCTKHTTTPQPGERTTARHGRNFGSARFGGPRRNLPPPYACVHACASRRFDRGGDTSRAAHSTTIMT